MEMKAFNLEDDAELGAFLRGGTREIVVPGADKRVLYDPLKRVGVGLSRLGTSRAVASAPMRLPFMPWKPGSSCCIHFTGLS